MLCLTSVLGLMALFGTFVADQRSCKRANVQRHADRVVAQALQFEAQTANQLVQLHPDAPDSFLHHSLAVQDAAYALPLNKHPLSCPLLFAPVGN